MVIVVTFAFHESNEYYPQVFWDECLYKLAKKQWIMTTKIFDQIIWFGKTKEAKKKLFWFQKKKKDFDVDNIVISELHKTKNNSTYSETSLQRTPSGPQNSVGYREVSAT